MAGASFYGAYGKIPALGDFFRFGLSPDFITPWDHWLQEGMGAARMALGAQWQERYFSAPIWRFTLAPGLAGPLSAQGVLMVSVDRVGRQFPLTLARPLAADTDPVRAHFASAARFEALEDCALAALDEGHGTEALRAALAALPAPDPAATAAPAAAGAAITAGWISLNAAEPQLALAAALAARASKRNAVFTALNGAGQVLILCEGLPPPARFRYLIAPAASPEALT